MPDRAQRDLPSLKDAVHEWLWRTPIDGSAPQDEDAAARLEAFVARFLEAHAAFVERSKVMALRATPATVDHERVAQRYEREKQSVAEFLRPQDARLQRIRTAMLFIETYRELPLLAWPRELLDGLIETEQAFVVWRQRHARMVERVIGRRTGTGGSAGVDYLDQTALSYRVFRDLWAVRTLQLPRADAPDLQRPEFYDFARGS